MKSAIGYCPTLDFLSSVQSSEVLLTMEEVFLTQEDGLWTVDCGLRTVDSGPWTLDLRL